jgi:DNA-binding CsgD family transcriptional regulator
MIWMSRLSPGSHGAWTNTAQGQRRPGRPDGDDANGAAEASAVTIAPVSHPYLRLELTPRQLECLAWVAEGKSAIEIGMILGISDRTVEKHIARACEIFGVNRRIQAVDCARRLQLIGEG